MPPFQYDHKADEKEEDEINNKASKPKKDHPGFGQNLCDYFTEFSGSSSIHGIKYMGEQKRTIVEKLWWLMVFVASLSMCIYMIIKTYNKWQTSPVIVSLARSPTSVWQIPFPAITICSETKTRQSVYNFTDAYHRELAKNLTESELSEIEKISLVCDSHIHPYGKETIDYDTINFLTQVAPPFDEVFYECKWMNEKINCSDLFRPMLSEEGMCFTFNMLDREELFRDNIYHYKNFLQHGIKSSHWTLEGGYPKDIGRKAFPRRAFSAGQGGGLEILLRAYEKDLDYICRGPVQGFKLLLHHPAEIPRVSQQYFRAPLNQELVVAVKPNMMTTSEGLKGYHAQKRKCYFPSERYLQFYKVYTQQNCEVECLANYTLKKCDCVSVYMPHHKNTLMCGSGKTICVSNASIELLNIEVERSLILDNIDVWDPINQNQECDCLPSCTSITYNAETSQVDFNWPKYFEASKIEAKNLSGAQFSGLTLFFKEMQFITSERSELYGPTDFLANCGGLLGLFMGFSFLSVIEILYFLSLRLMCNIRNYGHHYWSGSPDILDYKHAD